MSSNIEKLIEEHRRANTSYKRSYVDSSDSDLPVVRARTVADKNRLRREGALRQVREMYEPVGRIMLEAVGWLKNRAVEPEARKFFVQHGGATFEETYHDSRNYIERKITRRNMKPMRLGTKVTQHPDVYSQCFVWPIKLQNPSYNQSVSTRHTTQGTPLYDYSDATVEHKTRVERRDGASIHLASKNDGTVGVFRPVRDWDGKDRSLFYTVGDVINEYMAYYDDFVQHSLRPKPPCPPSTDIVGALESDNFYFSNGACWTLSKEVVIQGLSELDL